MKRRLFEFIEYTGMSVRRFENACCLQRGNVSSMTDNSAIGSDKLSKIIDAFPELNIEWLLCGKGEMLHNDEMIQGATGRGGIMGANGTMCVSNRRIQNGITEVLLSQLEEKCRLLEERLKEKDTQMKEKDIQMKEKDIQIGKLLEAVLRNK